MATYQLPAPDPMLCTGDVATNWKSFKEAYTDYATAIELYKKDKAIQAATLKTVMGKECRQILARLEISEDESKDPAVVLDKLESYFEPTRNILYERFLFHAAEQQPNETVDQYIIRLRRLAETCNFRNLHDEMLRDRLVLGCKDKAARARLFRQKECDLKTALEALRISERTHEQLKQLATEEQETPVHALRMDPQSKKRKPVSSRGKFRTTPSTTPCQYCGGYHLGDRASCPAYRKTCNHCGKPNHFQIVCRRRKSQINKAAAPLAVVDEDMSTDSEESAFMVEEIGAVHHNKKGQYFAKIDFANGGTAIALDCQLDTGATCNVITHHDVCTIQQNGKPVLQPTSTKLKFYDGSLVTALGEYRAQCVYKGKSYNLDFKVIQGDQRPLLSGKTCQALGMIKIDTVNATQPIDLIDQYKDVFEGLGCLEGDYHIELDPTVLPVQHVPRRVPVALKEQLKIKLDSLVAQGIITPVTTPTPWISNLVAIKKPGKLRVCIDPRDLNKAIHRPKYQMPILDEILPALSNARLFSVLDAKDGFHQVKLDTESSYLTTFWSPYGRYRYLRMPFGISSAPEEFQRRMHVICQDLPGVAVIADDILVYGCGSTEEEYRQDHDANLKRLLQRARDMKLKLNKHKLRLRLSEVVYMGHRLTAEGVSPDPAKVKAIIDMPRPTDKKGVERLLGCVTYLSRFLPKLADVVGPLRQLTEKDTIFTWQTNQDKALNTVKQLVTTAPVLRYYDVTEEVTVQSDASQKGLGATLLQKGQPVAFASRSLSTTEQQYAQVEKECLAIVFACERFNQYLQGRASVTVDTDHKPLVPIFTKPIYNAPKRLQRMLMRLQKYSLKVQYCPGHKMYIADMLSRAYVLDYKPKAEEDFEIFKLQLEDQLFTEIEQISQIQYLRMQQSTQTQIRQVTGKDPTMQTLAEIIQRGWPDTRDDVPISARAYWGFKDELTLQDGLIFKGNKVVIPGQMKKEMLRKIHCSHQGPEACIRRAKDVIFWPGMTAEIRQLVSQCSVCNEFLQKQAKEPLMTYAIPTHPWQMVGQDLFTLDSQNYLITVDYFSDYWELDILPDTTSGTIVALTKTQFARFGIPETVLTDNGPQFRAESYAIFAKEWEFNHITSSPYHSQANGKAESAVKIAKRLIKKAKRDHQDIHLAILNWRNTPSEGNNLSPVQKLHSRRTKTLLPTTSELLQPRVPNNITEDIEFRRQKAKAYYDKGAHPLPPLEIGDTVRLQPQDKAHSWSKASVIKKVAERSYLVKTAQGHLLRRNRKFLRCTGEVPEEATNPALSPMEPERQEELQGQSEPVQDSQLRQTQGETPQYQEESTAAGSCQPDQSNSDTASSPIKSTRAGRTVKIPNRYRDFVKL